MSMNLSKLGHVKLFDNKGFFEPKTFMLMGEEPWKDFKSGKEIGVKLNLIIWSDQSDYGDPSVNNTGKPVVVKIANQTPDASVTPHLVRLINPQATIYGDYQNQLSVKADGFKNVKEDA